MMSRVSKLSHMAVVVLVTTLSGVNAASAQSDMNDAFVRAIEAGELKKVKQFVAKGADVNYKGALPLYWAAFNGQLEIVKFLVSAGANVNGITQKSESTALRGAAKMALYRKENYGIVDYLLSMGADPAIGGKKNRHSPLTAAVMTGHLDQVKKVVERGNADLEYKEWKRKPGDGLGKTALMIAAERKFVAIVDYLLQQGANPNTSLKCGETALNFAASRDQREIVKALLRKGANANPAPPDPLSTCDHPAPLLDAHDYHVIRMLLEAGADPNVQKIPAHDWTRPMFRATKRCDVGLIKLLVKHGAVFDAEDRQRFVSKCKKTNDLPPVTPPRIRDN